MTPQNDAPNTASIPVEFAVALGRIEEKLTGMSTNENKTGERLDKIDDRLTKLELNIAQNVRPKAPWYTIVGGLAAIAVLALNAWALLNLGAAIIP